MMTVSLIGAPRTSWPRRSYLATAIIALLLIVAGLHAPHCYFFMLLFGCFGNSEVINFALVNLVLRVLGPKRESTLCTVLLGNVDIH